MTVQNCDSVSTVADPPDEENVPSTGVNVAPPDDENVPSWKMTGGTKPMDAQIAWAFVSKSTDWSTFFMVSSSAFTFAAFANASETAMQYSWTPLPFVSLLAADCGFAVAEALLLELVLELLLSLEAEELEDEGTAGRRNGETGSRSAAAEAAGMATTSKARASVKAVW